MFGGLAFLIGGHMAVSASGRGGLLLHVDRAETEALLAKPHAQPFEMRGRVMEGWVRVDADGREDQAPARALGRPGRRPRPLAAAQVTLLSAIDVGPLRLRNRVVSTSHQTSLVHDHLPTEELLAYHEARARGGVGTIFLEATAVHASGLLTPHTVGGFLPEIVAAYQRLGERLHPHDTRLMVQLFHGGREQISSAPRAPAVAPSAIPSLRFKSEPRALTAAEIDELIAGYATAARLAAEGGVDGLELSMSHGYLPGQFLSPLSNRRGDGFDGSLAARMRFSVEVLRAVRAAAGPAMAIGARLSADELIPGGLGVRDCAEIAGRLRADGLDRLRLARARPLRPPGRLDLDRPSPARPARRDRPGRGGDPRRRSRT